MVSAGKSAGVPWNRIVHSQYTIGAKMVGITFIENPAAVFNGFFGGKSGAHKRNLDDLKQAVRPFAAQLVENFF